MLTVPYVLLGVSGVAVYRGLKATQRKAEEAAGKDGPPAPPSLPNSAEEREDGERGS